MALHGHLNRKWLAPFKTMCTISKTTRSHGNDAREYNTVFARIHSVWREFFTIDPHSDLALDLVGSHYSEEAQQYGK